MTKAEEKALEMFPRNLMTVVYPDGVNNFIEENEFDINATPRRLFQSIYEQVQKEIVSIIESRIGEILGDAQPAPILREELRELIKRIKQ